MRESQKGIHNLREKKLSQAGASATLITRNKIFAIMNKILQVSNKMNIVFKTHQRDEQLN